MMATPNKRHQTLPLVGICAAVRSLTFLGALLRIGVVLEHNYIRYIPLVCLIILCLY